MLVFLSPSSPFPGAALAAARPGAVAADVQPGWAGQGPVLGRGGPIWHECCVSIASNYYFCFHLVPGERSLYQFSVFLYAF